MSRRSAIAVVFFKELREILRDRRALGLVLMFVLMYPLMVGGILQQQISRAMEPEKEGIELTVIGAARAPTLMTQLKQKNVNVTESGALSEEQITALLRTQKTAAVLRLSESYGDDYRAMRPARVELWFNSASEARYKVGDIEHVLRQYGNVIAGARLLAHGVSPATLYPVQVQKYDTGSSASRSAQVIGTMLGMFFIPAFFFCLSSAVDSTAGERERRSLEVLLAQPARPIDLIGGKWLAASFLSVVGLTLELLIAHSVLKWLPLEEIGMSWRLSWLDLAWVLLTSLSLPLFAAAMEIALAINAKSFKEAQTTASFAIMLPIVPVIVVPMMNLNTATWMYLVPVLSHQTLLRELAQGQPPGLLAFALTFGGSLLLALLCLAFTVRRLKSDRYLMGI
ncbi:ABC transporter permease [Pseudoduganella buxea]|uniref:ABC transporter permease subunit n=1 Tax=Pseudoduganella buxea TaxID=1949069 RepID=A0A6I3T0B5_9BURK|nr:ABC transporter permease [Pseudoduganella buxea]MTV54988.1 ABC transporter permease subunit [Pseudoduganella buxea]GGB90998.1 sodium ABC transporter permease [Pseudoduganella buxea]